ncbi:hypothetical protein BCR42DRAFT_440582 [Absidia repens]|uniref:Chromo domain-containing protein n=1 Tax=Absidia repens TaxID=90262 RepID=A0A1X2I8M1_9FUNG|nr:hypothetical protein BCR42DRAFT_440582 [Absidia repens]
MNNKVSKRLQTPPFSLMFARHMNKPTLTGDPQTNIATLKPMNYDDLVKRLEYMADVVFPAIKEPFVVAKIPTRKNKSALYDGPFEVMQKTINGTYVLKDMTGALASRNYVPSELKSVSHDEHNDDEYEIEAVLDHKGTPGRRQYKVRWKGVSVISEHLAKEVGLQANSDKLNVCQDQHLCDVVVVDVPVTVCGGAKARTYCMCVERGADPDLFLLGMTWFQQYAIPQNPGAGLIHLPDGFGNMVDLLYDAIFDQGWDDEDTSVTAVMALVTDHSDDGGKDDAFSSGLVGLDDPIEQWVGDYKNCFVEVAGPWLC